MLTNTGLAFHRVAEFPYPIALMPLGSDALLVAGERWNQIPILIEENQVLFRPELTRLDDVTGADTTYFISAIGGNWPDSAWMALSSSSDAGPSYSDVYQWNAVSNPGRRGDSQGGDWVKKYEYPSGVFKFASWRGNLVLLSTALAAGVMIRPQLEEFSSSGRRKLVTSVCGPSDNPVNVPSWLHDGALSLAGYECDGLGHGPEGRNVVVVETWASDGTMTLRRLPFPDGFRNTENPGLPPFAEQLVLDPQGVAAVFPDHEKTRRHLARFVQNRWTTVEDLPPDWVRLSAPDTLDLWGISELQLRLWNGSGWSVTQLPSMAPSPALLWMSVWQRSPKDIWLIGKAQTVDSGHEKYFLFNTADGRQATALPTELERRALGTGMAHEPENCPHPFADLLAQRPFQLGYDDQVQLSPQEARQRLKAIVIKHPRFRHLKFVEHGCYGEQCIGATVSDRQEADAFRKVLAADRFSRDRVRCQPPPDATPFGVPR